MSDLLHVQPEWLALVIAMAAGVLGALVATFVQKLAIGLAGFLAGAFLIVLRPFKVGDFVTAGGVTGSVREEAAPTAAEAAPAATVAEEVAPPPAAAPAPTYAAAPT